MPFPVTIDDIREAREHLGRIVRRTPMVEAPAGLGPEGSRVFLKLENLQLTGSFKLRGASNKVAHLTKEEASRGVIAASAGNHAQGVAYAARAHGIPATIVMPANASPTKVVATEALGAKVVLAGADYQEAYEEARRRAEKERLAFVHPYDDPLVIAGQGTVGLEVLEDLPSVRTILVGVGGGGLAAGVAIALKNLHPEVRVIAVQPKGSGSLKASLAAGKIVEHGPPETFADGLATRHVGQITFQILRELVDQAVEVDERELARAVFFLLEKAHIMAEGAGAAPVAALLAHPELARGDTVAVVSGGNLDPFLLDRIVWSGLSSEGRVVHLRTPLQDRPGALARFLSEAAVAKANVHNVRHDRESPTLTPGQAAVEVELEVRDRAHADEVVAHLRKMGWAVERISL